MKRDYTVIIYPEPYIDRIYCVSTATNVEHFPISTGYKRIYIGADTDDNYWQFIEMLIVPHDESQESSSHRYHFVKIFPDQLPDSDNPHWVYVKNGIIPDGVIETPDQED